MPKFIQVGRNLINLYHVTAIVKAKTFNSYGIRFVIRNLNYANDYLAYDCEKERDKEFNRIYSQLKNKKDFLIQIIYKY